MANPEYANGEVIANKFVVEGFLGESPAGRIYVATGNAGAQKAAVKFYKPEVSARLLASPDFFLKASVMTEIEHDNLCACFDVQEEMGCVFTARAFAEGQSLEEWARKHRSDSNYYTRGLELLWQTTQGLIALHERTRHLDIHPGNVIVGPLVAKLCDWDPRALGNMEMIPDPLPSRPEYQGYKAPEAAGRGSFLSYPSTDLYAVAALLYRLVKGEHPAGDPAQMVKDARAWDGGLAQFLSKALHPRPEERFQDAGAFSDALWELQGAMQGLQDRNPGKPAPAKREEPKPYQPPPQAKPAPEAKAEPTLFGTPPPKPSTGDTFFNFFPADNAAPANPPATKPPFQGVPTPPSGETLFGAAPTPPKKSEPPAKPVKSGLAALESDTLFGSKTAFPAEKTTFPAAPPAKSSAKAARDNVPAKPIPVSLSSLEKDPMDLTNAGEAGFTQFGFKNAGERTGMFQAEPDGASTKRKLMIALAAVGGLVVLLALAGLFVYLRGSAAPKLAETPAVPESNSEVTPPPAPAPVAARPETPAAPGNTQATPPYPEEAQPAPETPAPEPRAADKPRHSAHAAAPHAESAPAPAGSGTASATREAELERMVQTRQWPAAAAERLKAADELNDMSKTAEANVAYGKTLLAKDVTAKQKILALGGLAVTFQKMGMKNEALDAVNRLLQLSPRNAFALKLKDQLQ